MTKNQILHKGDIIINPLTSRPVKVGGTVWRKLVKQGLVHGAYKDPKGQRRLRKVLRCEIWLGRWLGYCVF